MKKIIKRVTIYLILMCIFWASLNVEAANMDYSQSPFLLHIYDRETAELVCVTNCMALKSDGLTYLVTSYTVYHDFPLEQYLYFVILDAETGFEITKVHVEGNNYTVVLMGKDNTGQMLQGSPLGSSLDTTNALTSVYRGIDSNGEFAYWSGTFHANEQNSMIIAEADLGIQGMWLGAPVFHENSDYVVGMGLGLANAEDGSVQYVLADITNDIFFSEYSVESWSGVAGETIQKRMEYEEGASNESPVPNEGSKGKEQPVMPERSEGQPIEEEQPETQPETQPVQSDDGEISKETIIVIALVCLIVGKHIYDKNKINSVPEEMPNRNDNRNNKVEVINISDYQPKVQKRFYLEGIGGYYAGKSFPLENTLTLGRDPRYCNIVYPSDENGRGISRQHCQLSVSNGNVMIMDLGSKCGTYFQNRERLTPHERHHVNPGTVFYLAGLNNIFRVIVK